MKETELEEKWWWYINDLKLILTIPDIFDRDGKMNLNVLSSSLDLLNLNDSIEDKLSNLVLSLNKEGERKGYKEEIEEYWEDLKEEIQNFLKLKELKND